MLHVISRSYLLQVTVMVVVGFAALQEYPSVLVVDVLSLAYLQILRQRVHVHPGNRER